MEIKNNLAALVWGEPESNMIKMIKIIELDRKASKDYLN